MRTEQTQSRPSAEEIGPDGIELRASFPIPISHETEQSQISQQAVKDPTQTQAASEIDHIFSLLQPEQNKPNFILSSA